MRNFANEKDSKYFVEAKLKSEDSVKSSPISIRDICVDKNIYWLAKDITSDSFNSITSRYNKELMNLNSEIEALNATGDSIKEYVNDGLELLVNLNHLFLEADYDGKVALAGSLFPKNIVFWKFRLSNRRSK